MAGGIVKNLTTNTSTAGVDVIGPATVIVSEGTWGGGTLTIERYNTDLDDWLTVIDGAFAADFNKVLNFPPGAENTLRGTLAGSSGADLNIEFQGSSPRV